MPLSLRARFASLSQLEILSFKERIWELSSAYDLKILSPSSESIHRPDAVAVIDLMDTG